jgi:hypothetical protein
MAAYLQTAIDSISCLRTLLSLEQFFIGTSFFINADQPETYTTAAGTSRLIIATFTASFTTRHETIA